VYEAFYDDDVARGFLHSHSYTGNPLACRAALATLELFEQTDVLGHNALLAQTLDRAFAPLTQHPAVRHARRLGMIWAWDIDEGFDGARPQPRFASRYAQHAMAQGVVLRPIGNTVYAMPPYALDEETAGHLARGALAALEATLAEQGDAHG
jgi:adenosylmethionine---8-amino-7-oxononanoate aminotransferase